MWKICTGVSHWKRGSCSSADRLPSPTSRAEAKAWSIRMEGFGGPAQPHPRSASTSTAAPVVRGGATAARPARACRFPPSARHAAVKAGGFAKMPRLPQRPLRAAGAHDQADGESRDHSAHVGASDGVEVGHEDHIVGSLDTDLIAARDKQVFHL